MKKSFYFISIALLFLSFGAKASATTILSPLLSLEVDPGKSQKGIVKIYNETNDSLSLVAAVESFNTANELGQPSYLPVDEKTSYVDWFKLSQKEILLLPHQAVIVPFTVTVPKAAIPGGYYTAIFWQTQPNNTDLANKSSINSRVGTLVFLKVKGEVVEAGQLLDFSPTIKQSVFWQLPINFVTRFENSGTIHLQPSGQITVSGWFKTISLPVNQASHYVLPKSIRRFETVWGRPQTSNLIITFWHNLQDEMTNLSFGPYQARLEVSAGERGTISVGQTISFWVIPYHSIIAFIVLIFAIIIFLKINRKANQLKFRGTNKV